MEISESLKKMVLCYLYSLGGQVSYYKFDRMIVYSFKSDILPGYFIKSFLDFEFVNKIIPDDGQMESYQITESGRKYIVKELVELEKVFDKLMIKLKALELENVELKGPFLRFSILDRVYKISIFLDDQSSKLILSLPNNLPEVVEHVEYSLSDVLNDPKILSNRIKDQINILTN